MTITMRTSAAVTIMTTNIIITTMIMNADVDTTIMTITIIMQMKYLQVGVVRQLRNIQKTILRRCWKHAHTHSHIHEEHEHTHEHHHEHDENCTCGCHDHDHHHHHHADEVFTSWGIETPNTYSAEDIEKILTALDSGEYGAILRAKGMVPAPDGTWVYYDYVPEEHDIRSGKPEVTGKICVIGSKLDEDKLAELFRK